MVTHEAAVFYTDYPLLSLGYTTYGVRPDNAHLWTWHDSCTLSLPGFNVRIRLKPEDAEVVRAFMVAAAL